MDEDEYEYITFDAGHPKDRLERFYAKLAQLMRAVVVPHPHPRMN